jgi:glycosyltransferase 2 family protein
VAPTRWKAAVKPAIKLVLAAAVLVAVGRHVARTARELREQGRSVQIDPAWAAIGMALYVVGLAACGLYFGRVLRASATPVGYVPALRAYYISHLGKYVPGKAWVVVMRVALVAPYGARPATAAFATFYETLAMMAAGGLVAALGFGIGRTPRLAWPVRVGGSVPEVSPAWLGLFLAASFLVVVWPPVFARLSAMVSLPLPNVGPDALPRLSGRLLAEGLAWSAAGWVLLGLSQVAVLRALGVAGVGPGQWPAVVAAVALATVAGFAVPIAPGGLGVREWVLWTSLESAVDREMAVVAALALRLTWVVGECLAAAAIGAARPAPPEPEAGAP